MHIISLDRYPSTSIKSFDKVKQLTMLLKCSLDYTINKIVRFKFYFVES